MSPLVCSLSVPTAEVAEEKVPQGTEGRVHCQQGELLWLTSCSLVCVHVLTSTCLFSLQENHVRGGVHRTPQGSSQSAARHMTPAASPLLSIQPCSTRLPSPSSPLTPSCLTPGPAYLLENVKKLSLAESDETAVRRCLFPAPNETHTRTPHHSHKHSSQVVAGRRENKNRLRRL